MNNVIKSYRDLIVWQRAAELAVAIYALTINFPLSERFGLTSQMQRSAVSIASNIAEGRHRTSRKDFLRFLRIAYASGAELETQIFIAKQLNATRAYDYVKVDDLLLQTMKMLNALIQKVKAKSPNLKPET